jgi:rod shape-determining protein MreD
VSVRLLIRSLLVLIVFLLIESVLVLEVRLGSAHPDIIWLLPIAAGLIGGVEEGAVVGFTSGLAADLLLPTPFGLTALVGCMIGTGVGLLSSRRLQLTEGPAWRVVPTVAVAASAIAVMLYAVLGALLGQEQILHTDLVSITLVVAISNGVLALPAFYLVRWALGATGRRRISLESRW